MIEIEIAVNYKEAEAFKPVWGSILALFKDREFEREPEILEGKWGRTIFQCDYK